MNPDHLRAAIERIGIEKDSDYTLVMEEVGRMEAEEKLVERKPYTRLADIPHDLHCKADAIWEHWDTHFATENTDEIVLISMIARGMWEERQKCASLLSAAEAVLAAGIVNPTGSMKVANAMDALVKAVREVKG